MSELKACLRCGNTGYSIPRQYVIEIGEEPKQVGWACGCMSCDLHVYGYAQADTEQKWQSRPIEDALRLARDRAVSMVERLIEAAENLMDEAEVRLIEPSTSEVLIQWNTLVTEAQKEQKDV